MRKNIEIKTVFLTRCRGSHFTTINNWYCLSNKKQTTLRDWNDFSFLRLTRPMPLLGLVSCYVYKLYLDHSSFCLVKKVNENKWDNDGELGESVVEQSRQRHEKQLSCLGGEPRIKKKASLVRGTESRCNFYEEPFSSFIRAGLS